MEKAEYVRSQKGHEKLVDRGHLFVKEKKCKDKTIWKCDQHRNLSCRARIHTMENSIVNRIGEHSHAGDAARVEVTKILNETKRRASETQDAPHCLIADTFSRGGPVASGKLPSCDSLKRSIRNVRNRRNAVPPCPANLSELRIPDEFRQTNRGENFLLYDSNDGEHRILIFSTTQNLLLLSSALDWYADGTFSTVPSLFQQLYTIHGIRNNIVLPAVFALLPRKNEQTYVRFLNALRNLQPDLIPHTIMTDFEPAAINAFQQVFPCAIQRGCFFHFNQCIYRNIQSNGLQRRYETDADFALKMRMIPALAFVPVSDVPSSFEQLCRSGIIPDEAQSVLDYFEDTWIGNPDRMRGRREPCFPHEMWNVYDAVQDDLPKTNNSCEGWHRSFKETIGAQHPSIWKFIKALKAEQSLTEGKIEQYMAGLEPAPSKKRYRDSASRIQRVVSDFNNRNLLDYLRGIAHNFNF